VKPPEVLLKPFGSFFLKTFRKNVVLNDSWPDAPDSGWLLPTKWFEQVNDIVRTLVVVKYLDEVQFLADSFTKLCAENDLETTLDFEAKPEGYYAAHLYVRHTFEIPKMTWDTERRKIWLEIQISTQLQEVIRRLTHNYYERRRTRPRPVSPAKKWQWDYQSDEFTANYLGHILHYVEGMIMEVRDRQQEAE
jgi:ppGpp synthetase/RelA/SpoT-type nucleotidyltranferase